MARILELVCVYWYNRRKEIDGEGKKRAMMHDFYIHTCNNGSGFFFSTSIYMRIEVD